MSNLVYNANLRTGDAQTFAPEEPPEASTRNTKTQVKLDPLQICLFPTYLSLEEQILREDLRTNLQELVTTQFSQSYGDDFSYFAVTDAQIDWHSGEDVVCSNAIASSTQTVPSSRKAEPCTCALYTGATAMFEHAGARTSGPFVTPEQLEPQISSVLQDSLVQALRNDDPTSDVRPFYTELKGTFVSWSAAERQSGGKLVYLDPPEFDQQVSEQPLVGESPSTPVLDESFGDSTVIDVVTVNAVDGSDIQENTPSGANAFATKKGKILASVLGAVLFVILVILGFVLRRNQRRNAQSKDSSTVVSQDELPRDEVDEEIARGEKGLASKVDMEEDDQSEAAQYKVPKNNLLDCISVGSEWTLATGVSNGLGSILGYSSCNKSMAEMMAAKETFDRDRQITLQKDMLQSEWSSPVSPSTLALSRKGSKSTVKKSTTTIDSGESGGLKFAEAEGEEIYLMPSPTR